MKHIVPLCAVVLSVILNSYVTAARQHNNVVHNKVVKKEHFTLDNCAKSCLEEDTIDCKYFKFVNATGTCFLSARDHPDFSAFDKAKIKVTPSPKPKTTPKPKPKTNTESIDDLKKKYQGITQNLNQLKGIKDDLRNINAAAVGSENHLIASLSRRTHNTQATLNSHRKVIKWLTSRVKPINKAFLEIRQNQHAVRKQLKYLKKVGNLSKKTQKGNQNSDYRLSTAVKNLLATNAMFRQRMHRFHNSNKRLWQRMKNIRKALYGKSQVMEKEQVLKLAGALSLVNKRQQSIQSKISKIQGAINRIAKFAAQTSGPKSNAVRQMQELKSAISILRDDLRKISKPLVQKLGRQDTKLSKISTDMTHLLDAQNYVTSDLTETKHSVASVVRDLADVQVASQSFQSQLEDMKVRTNSIIHDIRLLAREQSDLPSIINMAKMEAKLLKSLEMIHQKEGEITDSIIHFKSTLNHLLARMANQEKATSTINLKLGEIESSMVSIHKTVFNMGRQMKRMKWAQRRSAQIRIPEAMKAMAVREKKLLQQTWYLRNKLNKIAKLAHWLSAQRRKEHHRDLQQMKRLEWQIRRLKQWQSKMHKFRKQKWQRYMNRKKNKQVVKKKLRKKWKKNKSRSRKYKAKVTKQKKKSKDLKKSMKKLNRHMKTKLNQLKTVGKHYKKKAKKLKQRKGKLLSWKGRKKGKKLGKLRRKLWKAKLPKKGTKGGKRKGKWLKKARKVGRRKGKVWKGKWLKKARKGGRKMGKKGRKGGRRRGKLWKGKSRKKGRKPGKGKVKVLKGFWLKGGKKGGMKGSKGKLRKGKWRKKGKKGGMKKGKPRKGKGRKKGRKGKGKLRKGKWRKKGKKGGMKKGKPRKGKGHKKGRKGKGKLRKGKWRKKGKKGGMKKGKPRKGKGRKKGRKGKLRKGKWHKKGKKGKGKLSKRKWRKKGKKGGMKKGKPRKGKGRKKGRKGKGKLRKGKWRKKGKKGGMKKGKPRKGKGRKKGRKGKGKLRKGKWRKKGKKGGMRKGKKRKGKWRKKGRKGKLRKGKWRKKGKKGKGKLSKRKWRKKGKKGGVKKGKPRKGKWRKKGRKGSKGKGKLRKGKKGRKGGKRKGKLWNRSRNRVRVKKRGKKHPKLVAKSRRKRVPIETPRSIGDISKTVSMPRHKARHAGRSHLVDIQGTCPYGFIKSTIGDFCFISTTSVMTHSQAAEYCDDFKGELVAVDSQKKQKALTTFLNRNHFQNNELFWISSTKTVEDLWVWQSTYKPVEYMNFEVTPLSHDRQCHLLNTTNGKWVTRSCTEYETVEWIVRKNIHHVVCEPIDRNEIYKNLLKINHNKLEQSYSKKGELKDSVNHLKVLKTVRNGNQTQVGHASST